MGIVLSSAAASVVSDARLGLSLALEKSQLDRLQIAPNWDIFPFIGLVSNMVGGLWAMGLVLMVGAWILASVVWVLSRVIHSGQMQQYSGTVFIWCGIGTVLLGAAMTMVKLLATQDMGTA